MKNETIQNPQIQLANDFIQYTGKHLFLTGKAGTGKTTFLHHLKKKSPKRMIVVAPTGVAAINAGGVTIHSFFQISFGPQVQGYSGAEQQGFKRFSKEKRNIMKSLDLLVIDEISMVRADLLDGVDETLRRIRNNSQPFGGVQLLMIGDLQQLAPVVKNDEWSLLRKHYQTVFFFSSNALQRTSYVTIVLQHVYRQSDQHFINLLNKIRDNKTDNLVIDELNKRYQPDFDPGEEKYIILTTHNAKARSINDKKLGKIEDSESHFKATVSGNFPEYTFPTEVDLVLKKGAQVMFVKNDPNPEKIYYNGKIGTIIQIDGDEVIVQCPGNDEPIEVGAIEWNNYKYTIHEETKEIEETVEGTFTQIPLKLAWAITIHKSQGLTFDKAIIDSESAFAHGQVYVALSRCRSLEGLVLSSQFSPNSLKHDHTIQGFNKNAEENQPGEEVLNASKYEYQAQLLYDLFSFEQLQKGIYNLQKAILENVSDLHPGITAGLNAIIDNFRIEIDAVSVSFKKQLRHYLLKKSDAEHHAELQERIIKATTYFIDKIEKLILLPLGDIDTETDNQEKKRKIKQAEENVREALGFKIACLEACNKEFIVTDYLLARAMASLEKPKKKSRSKKEKTPVSKDINNPELYELLKQWRNSRADELGMKVFMVLPLKTMRALSNQVPENLDQLKLVHGFGKRKMEKFGAELLDLLNNFRNEHDVKIVGAKKEETKKKLPKQNTRQVSFELWQKHRDIAKVAIEREMVITTIESHLMHFIEKGDLAVTEFVSDEKLIRITNFFDRNDVITISEAKVKLGDEISYSDLKFVKSHLIFQKSDSTSKN